MQPRLRFGCRWIILLSKEKKYFKKGCCRLYQPERHRHKNGCELQSFKIRQRMLYYRRFRYMRLNSDKKVLLSVVSWLEVPVRSGIAFRWGNENYLFKSENEMNYTLTHVIKLMSMNHFCSVYISHRGGNLYLVNTREQQFSSTHYFIVN